MEVDEGEVGGGVGDQLLLLVLVALERLDGLLGVRVRVSVRDRVRV